MFQNYSITAAMICIKLTGDHAVVITINPLCHFAAISFEIARNINYNAQIIPLALDYDRGKNLCRVKFGAPLAGSDLADNRNGIRTLRDVMATLRWEMMEDRPTLSRAETDPEELKKEVETAISEYPTLDWEYECSCIYQPPNHIPPDKAFEYLQHLIP